MDARITGERRVQIALEVGAGARDRPTIDRDVRVVTAPPRREEALGTREGGARDLDHGAASARDPGGDRRIERRGSAWVINESSTAASITRAGLLQSAIAIGAVRINEPFPAACRPLARQVDTPAVVADSPWAIRASAEPVWLPMSNALVVHAT